MFQNLSSAAISNFAAFSKIANKLYENRLLADDSHEISYLIITLFLSKTRKDVTKLSSAAISNFAAFSKITNKL